MVTAEQASDKHTNDAINADKILLLPVIIQRLLKPFKSFEVKPFFWSKKIAAIFSDKILNW